MMIIVALRNEKGSYNFIGYKAFQPAIVALRNEKGSYNGQIIGWAIVAVMAAAWGFRIIQRVM